MWTFSISNLAICVSILRQNPFDSTMIEDNAFYVHKLFFMQSKAVLEIKTILGGTFYTLTYRMRAVIWDMFIRNRLAPHLHHSLSAVGLIYRKDLVDTCT